MLTDQDLTGDDDFDEFMLEHLPLGIALFEVKEFRLLRANHAFFAITQQRLGIEWSGEEVPGQRLQDALSLSMNEAQSEPTMSTFREVAQSGIPFQRSMSQEATRDNAGITWEFSLFPVRGADGKIEQLVSTIADISILTETFRDAELERTHLSQIHDTIEIERQQLQVIEEVARSAREYLDLRQVGKDAIDIINKNLHSQIACIHIDRPELDELQLLYIRVPPLLKHAIHRLSNTAYNSDSFTARARLRDTPIIIEDIPLAVGMGVLSKDHLLAQTGHNSYACIPLWFQGHFEGALSATFNTPINEDSREIQTLQGCAGYLAAAIAHARLHAQIENERAHLRAVLDQLPQCVFIIEARDQVISYMNSAAQNVKGLQLSGFIGHRVSDLLKKHTAVNKDGQPHASDDFVYSRALRGEVLSGHETIFTTQDGRIFTFLVSAAPLLTKDGQISGAVIASSDISARKAIEREKNEFLLVASHELRTPVTTIQRLAEILQALDTSREGLESPRSQNAIEEIIEQSQQLILSINEMLDLTRIENEQLLLNRGDHDLLETVQAVIETYKLTSDHHSINLKLNGLTTADTLMGYFDKERIMQVLNNLLANAFKFSPTGSVIEVGIDYRPDLPGEVMLWVKNSGIEIPPGELAYVFERVPNTSSSKRFSRSLGIGLYVVKELIKRHNGRVWVESSSKTGSTFHILLPLAARGH